MRYVQDVLDDLSTHHDEPETVSTLILELRAALTRDIHTLLILLIDACESNNYIQMEMSLSRIDEIIDTHVHGFVPDSTRDNRGRWLNVRSHILACLETRTPSRDGATYVRMLDDLIRNGWKFDENRWCLAKHSSCRNCQHQFDSQDVMVCPDCGTVRGLCRSKAEIGLNGCYRHTNAKERPSIKDHPGSMIYGFKGKRFSEIFQAALRNEEMLSNVDSIAMFMARMTHLMEAWEEADGQDVVYSVKRIVMLKASLSKAMEAEEPDPDRISRLADSILRAVEVLKQDRQQWQEMRETAELLRRLRESERARVIEAHNTLTVEQAMSMLEILVGHLIEAIDQYVIDNEQREKVYTFMNRVLVNSSARRALPKLANGR